MAVDPETRTSVPPFHARRQQWHEHFAWSEDQLRVVGLTPTGRATVMFLHLNRRDTLESVPEHSMEPRRGAMFPPAESNAAPKVARRSTRSVRYYKHCTPTGLPDGNP